MDERQSASGDRVTPQVDPAPAPLARVAITRSPEPVLRFKVDNRPRRWADISEAPRKCTTPPAVDPIPSLDVEAELEVRRAQISKTMEAISAPPAARPPVVESAPPASEAHIEFLGPGVRVQAPSLFTVEHEQAKPIYAAPHIAPASRMRPERVSTPVPGTMPVGISWEPEPVSAPAVQVRRSPTPVPIVAAATKRPVRRRGPLRRWRAPVASVLVGVAVGLIVLGLLSWMFGSTQPTTNGPTMSINAGQPAAVEPAAHAVRR